MSEQPVPHPAERPVRRRDRHDRGRPFTPVRPAPGRRDPRPGSRARFDAVALAVVTDLDTRWRARLGPVDVPVEYAVEDMPLLPRDWSDEVPLGSLVRPTVTSPARVVLFRRPLERRTESRAELEDLVRRVAAEQVAELLGLVPRDVDPDYEED